MCLLTATDLRTKVISRHVIMIRDREVATPSCSDFRRTVQGNGAVLRGLACSWIRGESLVALPNLRN